MRTRKKPGGPPSVPAFRGRVKVNPKVRRELGVGLGLAIAEASKDAAQYLYDNGLDEREFEVSRIQITVAPNPGPTSYAVTIIPSGG